MHIVIGILVAILIFAVLVIVHEGGHFAVAKAVGIKVNEFAIGMGPLIFQRQKGETKYSVRAFPIGGYVAMEGEDSESEDERAFNNKPAWARAAVVAAGPVMNVVLAILVFIGMIMYNGTGVSNVISDVSDGSPAYEAGIAEGDKIISINVASDESGSESKSYEVESGETVKERLLEAYEAAGEDGAVEIGIQPKGEKSSEIIKIVPEENDEGNPIIGVTFKVKRNLFKAIGYGAQGAFEAEKLMLQTLVQLVTGQADTGDVVGPIGIVSIVDQTAQTGLYNIVYLLALLSLNLALVNILPFPALDGGRLLFIIIGVITRKAVSDELEAKIHYAGLIILFALMIAITIKDVNTFIIK